MAKWQIQTLAASGREILKQETWTYYKTVTLSSTARDTGNGQRSTALRKGLCLGKITSTSEYAQYNQSATDGTETMTGVLSEDVDLFNDAGVQADSTGLMLVVGIVDNSQLIGIDSYGRTDMNAPASGRLMVFDGV